MIKKLSLMLVLLVLVGCVEQPVMPQQILVERPYVVTPTTTYVSTVANTNTCTTCSNSYTVRTPVEVLYKNTTYTTVYEPKTFTRTSYERVPYNCAKGQICK
jgi:hypothetical protein